MDREEEVHARESLVGLGIGLRVAEKLVLIGSGTFLVGFLEGCAAISQKPIPLRFAINYAAWNVLPSFVWQSVDLEILATLSRIKAGELVNFHPNDYIRARRIALLKSLRCVRYGMASYGLVWTMLRGNEALGQLLKQHPELFGLGSTGIGSHQQEIKVLGASKKLKVLRVSSEREPQQDKMVTQNRRADGDQPNRTLFSHLHDKNSSLHTNGDAVLHCNESNYGDLLRKEMMHHAHATGALVSSSSSRLMLAPDFMIEFELSDESLARKHLQTIEKCRHTQNVTKVAFGTVGVAVANIPRSILKHFDVYFNLHAVISHEIAAFCSKHNDVRRVLYDFETETSEKKQHQQHENLERVLQCGLLYQGLSSSRCRAQSLVKEDVSDQELVVVARKNQAEASRVADELVAKGVVGREKLCLLVTEDGSPKNGQTTSSSNQYYTLSMPSARDRILEDIREMLTKNHLSMQSIQDEIFARYGPQTVFDHCTEEFPSFDNW